MKVLACLLEDKNASTEDISAVLGITPRAVADQIATLKDNGLLKRIGPDKGGYLEVLK